MRKSITSLLVLISISIILTGCPPKPPTGDTPPESQNPVVVNTFPEDPTANLPDITSAGLPDLAGRPCVGSLVAASKSVALAPGLITNRAHFVFVFDMAWSKTREYEPDPDGMVAMYNCLMHNTLIAGDRLSVLPYAYATEFRTDRGSWAVEVPFDDHRENLLGSMLPNETIMGSWNWYWAMVDVIDRVNEYGSSSYPVVIVAVSGEPDGALVENEEEALPNGWEKFVSRFTGDLTERESESFIYESDETSENPFNSSEMTVHILVNEAAAKLETEREYLNVTLSLDNDYPIYPGELIILSADLPERLEHAADAGLVRFYWRSGAPVTGDIDPKGKKVKWIYGEPGEYIVNVGVGWSDGKDSYFVEDELAITIDEGVRAPEENALDSEPESENE